MVVGAIVGFIIGFCLALIGIPTEIISIVSGVVGFVIGLCLSLIPVYWVLGRNYGDFRLALIKAKK